MPSPCIRTVAMHGSGLQKYTFQNNTDRVKEYISPKETPAKIESNSCERC